jgi:antitoxin component YwqK of YwqJK toxin-antitoxin module
MSFCVKIYESYCQIGIVENFYENGKKQNMLLCSNKCEILKQINYDEDGKIRTTHIE